MGKSASVLLFWNLFSQVISFLKTLVVASVYGVSLPLDAFNLSLAMPAIICGVFSAFMQAGFVPVYMRLRSNETTDEADDFCGRYYWNMILVLIAIAVLTYLTRGFWGGFWAGGDPELAFAVSTILSLVVLTAVLNASVDFFSIALNCHGMFGIASFSPAINGVISAAVIYFLPTGKIEILVLSLVFGWITQLVVVSYAIKLANIQIPFRVGSGGNTYFLGSLPVLAVVLPAAFFSNATNSVVQYYLAKLETGELSIFGYALRFHSAVSQIFVIGIGTIVLPFVVGLVNRKEMDRLARWIYDIFIYGFLISAMTATLVHVFGKDLIDVLLVRGGFSETNAIDVSKIWFLLTISIYPFAMVTFLSKVFIAMEKAKYLSFISTFVFFLTWVWCEFTYANFGSSSIALSTGFSQTFALVIALFFYFYLMEKNKIFFTIVPELVILCVYAFSLSYVSEQIVSKFHFNNKIIEIVLGTLVITALFSVYIPLRVFIVKFVTRQNAF